MRDSLLCAEVEPQTCLDTLRTQLDGVGWVLGNHTDELTPWVPVIARRLADRQLEQEEQEEQEQEQQQEQQQQQEHDEGRKDVPKAVQKSAHKALACASLPPSPLPPATPPSAPRWWVLPCCLWDIGPGADAVKFIGHLPKLGTAHASVSAAQKVVWNSAQIC